MQLISNKNLILLFLFLGFNFSVAQKLNYCKNYYKNGKIQSEGWLNNGKKEKYWFFYYENGNKKEEGHFQNNLKTNWWIFYTENNKIKQKSEFKNNALNGLTLVFDNGKIAYAEKYENNKITNKYTSISQYKNDPKNN